ncbi:ATP-binding protein [Megamonas funiformis]|uniref:Schlafen AlbA-2 domain-containing protein n=1 Tax=Megamonas funiformis YIT 11815 TaxID=742816 RepID=A0ABP2NHW6_9FIRM|nr:ATP-binding protein [Megamonas funiformis]EHR34192.1 hypothetical protein HMPREF9454_02057 [Megamonas funiformis YIT 11815]QIB60893.1 ATP-binding protein [Megamonas funiformis]RGJ94139.1 ATP-binding protein [Megamonas funiformis]
MKTEENIVTFINNLEAENQDIECKQCKRILPKDLWSTYSAFANTHGGKIILGITEIKNIEKNINLKLQVLKTQLKYVMIFGHVYQILIK